METNPEAAARERLRDPSTASPPSATAQLFSRVCFPCCQEQRSDTDYECAGAHCGLHGNVRLSAKKATWLNDSSPQSGWSFMPLRIMSITIGPVIIKCSGGQ